MQRSIDTIGPLKAWQIKWGAKGAAIVHAHSMPEAFDMFQRQYGDRLGENAYLHTLQEVSCGFHLVTSDDTDIPF